MKTIERVKFPIYPNSNQAKLIIRNCNNARFAYNWAVANIRKALDNREKIPTGYQLSKQFNEFKHQPGYEWLISNNASQRATKFAITKNINNGLRVFYKQHRRPPSFHSKKRIAKMSYYTDDENIRFKPNYVLLEGLGFVRCKHNIEMHDGLKIADPIVIFDGDNFSVSVVIKYKNPIKPKYHYSDVDIHSAPIGIDVGITHMAVTSNGDVFDLPKSKLSKLDKRIASIDRKIDKWRTKFRDSYYESLSCDMKTKYPESKDVKSQNLLKLESKRRKLYRKHYDIRKNIRCQAINSIVKQYPSAIVIEDIINPTEKWKIKGANKYNKRIADSSIGALFNQIKQKCEFLDIPLIKADSNYPSTKMCSCCGNTIANTLTRDRMFICSACGYKEDRDLNAAYNLRNLASTDIGKKKKKSKKSA